MRRPVLAAVLALVLMAVLSVAPSRCASARRTRRLISASATNDYAAPCSPASAIKDETNSSPM